MPHLNHSNDYLISIIVPYYNRPKCLPNLINSIQHQTYTNWELLIVDDFSDNQDCILKILAEASDQRIRYYRHPKNLNGAQARNTGLKHSKGEYVAFLESDDLWAPKKLEKQLLKIIHLEDSGDTIIYGPLKKMHINDRFEPHILPKRPKKNLESVSDYLFQNSGLMQTSTLFLPAQLAKKIQFNPNLIRHQDYDFVLRAEALGAKFEYLEDTLCSWVCLEGEENISNKGCELSFSINWLKTYSKYMSKTGYHGYLSRQMFYIAYKNRSLRGYYSYILYSHVF